MTNSSIIIFVFFALSTAGILTVVVWFLVKGAPHKKKSFGNTRSMYNKVKSTETARRKKAVKRTSIMNTVMSVTAVVSIICMALSIKLLHYNEKKELESEIAALHKYNSRCRENESNKDSLLLTNKSRGLLIDSLKKQEQDLRDLRDGIERRTRWLGKSDEAVFAADSALRTAAEEISRVKSYNEIADSGNIDVVAAKVAANANESNSSKVLLMCPEKTDDEYLDLRFKFRDDSLADSAKYIFVEIYSGSNRKNYETLYKQYYMPKKGENVFKVPNRMKDPGTTLIVGYFTEDEGKHCNYEKVTCSFWN